MKYPPNNEENNPSLKNLYTHWIIFNDSSERQICRSSLYVGGISRESGSNLLITVEGKTNKGEHMEIQVEIPEDEIWKMFKKLNYVCPEYPKPEDIHL